jgi:hypothetical protein
MACNYGGIEEPDSPWSSPVILVLEEEWETSQQRKTVFHIPGLTVLWTQAEAK